MFQGKVLIIFTILSIYHLSLVIIVYIPELMSLNFMLSVSHLKRKDIMFLS